MLADQSENDNRKAESQQSIHEENDEEYEKNIKIKILGASLKFVPDMGWSKQAISAGNSSHYFLYTTLSCVINNFFIVATHDMLFYI